MHGSNAEDAGSEKNKKYQYGVSWSMMSNVMNDVIQLFHGFCNHKVCEVIVMKWTMAIGNFLIAVSLLLFFFITNKFVFLLFTGLIVIYIAVPYAFVSIVIHSNDVGNNLGILNCFGVLGRQVSNLVIGIGVGKAVRNSPGKKIGYSAVFGFLASVASFWVIKPSDQYGKIQDALNDLNCISDFK